VRRDDDMARDEERSPQRDRDYRVHFASAVFLPYSGVLRRLDYADGEDSRQPRIGVITPEMSKSPIDGLPPPFEETMQRHEREIMRFLLRTTRDREDSLDLFQETWLRAYRAYPKLDGADGIRPWLYRIATNLCLNRVRDRARRTRVIVDDELTETHAARAVSD